MLTQNIISNNTMEACKKKKAFLLIEKGMVFQTTSEAYLTYKKEPEIVFLTSFKRIS